MLGRKLFRLLLSLDMIPKERLALALASLGTMPALPEERMVPWRSLSQSGGSAGGSTVHLWVALSFEREIWTLLCSSSRECIDPKIDKPPAV